MKDTLGITKLIFTALAIAGLIMLTILFRDFANNAKVKAEMAILMNVEKVFADSYDRENGTVPVYGTSPQAREWYDLRAYSEKPFESLMYPGHEYFATATINLGDRYSYKTFYLNMDENVPITPTTRMSIYGEDGVPVTNFAPYTRLVCYIEVMLDDKNYATGRAKTISQNTPEPIDPVMFADCQKHMAHERLFDYQGYAYSINY